MNDILKEAPLWNSHHRQNTKFRMRMRCNYSCIWNVKVLQQQRTKRHTHDVRNIKIVADTITRRGVGTDANIISKTCTMVSITDSNRTWNLYGTVRKLAYCTILSRTGCLRIQRCQQRTPRFWFRRFLTRDFPRDFGGLAQLGERLLCTQEVSGSNPLFSIGRNTLSFRHVCEPLIRRRTDHNSTLSFRHITDRLIWRYGSIDRYRSRPVRTDAPVASAYHTGQ